MALAGSPGLGPGDGQQLDSLKRDVVVTSVSNHVFKMVQRAVITSCTLKTGRSDVKVKNITDISQKTLRIADLQGKTSYHLVLRAYTDGGMGPEKSMFVVTKENCKLNIAFENMPIFPCLNSQCFQQFLFMQGTPLFQNFTFCCIFIVARGQC